MRLVYVFKKITTPTGEYEEGPDGFMVHKMDKWEGWLLEARLSDFGGHHILTKIKARYSSVKIRQVRTGVVAGVPDDYSPNPKGSHSAWFQEIFGGSTTKNEGE